jgi:hypothetical protein
MGRHPFVLSAGAETIILSRCQLHARLSRCQSRHHTNTSVRSAAEPAQCGDWTHVLLLREFPSIVTRVSPDLSSSTMDQHHHRVCSMNSTPFRPLTTLLVQHHTTSSRRRMAALRLFPDSAHLSVRTLIPICQRPTWVSFRAMSPPCWISANMVVVSSTSHILCEHSRVVSQLLSYFVSRQDVTTRPRSFLPRLHMSLLLS